MGPHSRTAAAVALLAAMVLVAGCATSIAGSPTIDPAAASALATASAGGPTTGGSTTGTAPSAAPPTTITGTAASGIFPTGTPIPPVAPSTTSSFPPPGTPTSAATPSTGPSTVLGVSIDDIVTELGHDPVAADDATRSSADPAALSALDRAVTDARNGGLDIWVVLIGHDVNGDLTRVSDAVATDTGGTAVVVTTSEFAVSSKLFGKPELQRAEDAAASASSPVKAASILVDQFRTMADSASTSATPTAAGGGSSSLPSFQLADHSIGCLITDGSVRCDLQVKPTFTPPKNPHPDCNGVYGTSISMSTTGKPAFGCISDTVFDPHAPVLADGGDTTVGDVMCFADGTELSCLNLTSAHGFHVSPTAYGIF